MKPERLKLAIIGLIIVGGLAMGASLALLPTGGLGRTLQLVVMLVFVGLLLWGTVAYWRALDEAAREAHKFAWYWGGSGGLFFTGVLLSSLLGNPDLAERIVGPDMAASDYAVFGITATVGFQVVGYVLTWAGWWLWKGR